MPMNALRGLAGVKSFSALRFLDLSYNALRFKSLDTVAEHCPHLNFLDVSHNELDSLKLQGGWKRFEEIIPTHIINPSPNPNPNPNLDSRSYYGSTRAGID